MVKVFKKNTTINDVSISEIINTFPNLKQAIILEDIFGARVLTVVMQTNIKKNEKKKEAILKRIEKNHKVSRKDFKIMYKDHRNEKIIYVVSKIDAPAGVIYNIEYDNKNKENLVLGEPPIFEKITIDKDAIDVIFAIGKKTKNNITKGLIRIQNLILYRFAKKRYITILNKNRINALKSAV